MTGDAGADVGRARAGLLGLPDAVTAGLFDLDGVLTAHRRGARQGVDRDLRRVPAGAGERTGEPFVRSTRWRTTTAYVDGKPRADGVRDFLASRGITLPEGTRDDGPGVETVNGLANRKNEACCGGSAPTGSRCSGLPAVPGGRAGTPACAAWWCPPAPTPRRCSRSPGWTTLVEGWIDGIAIVAQGLRGKPAPGHVPGRRRGASASSRRRPRCSRTRSPGVAAGRAGGFGFVVGVDRTGQADALRAHGADIVVSDLAELMDELNGKAAR